MDYPKINREGGYRLTIPALSGGLNLVDGLDGVSDNQLTECRNVWFKDGALRTRPAIKWEERQGFPFSSNLVFNQVLDTGEGRAQYLVYKSGVTVGGVIKAKLTFLSISTGGRVTSYPELTPCDYDDFSNVILFYGQPCIGKGLYLVVGQKSGAWSVWEYNNAWMRITDETPGLYAPLVLVNGKGDKYDQLPSSGKSPYPNAVTFEGFNTLFGRFRAGFFADPISETYQLPCALTDDSSVHISYCGRKGPEATSWTIPAYSNESPVDTVKGQRAIINRSKGTLKFVRAAENVDALYMVQGMPNSLVVTATAKQGDARSPAWMKQSVWFGGSAKGINGGSRLFMTGDPKQPGKVVWSDQGRPLYFPENCYAYVGENGRPVTTMAKQEDMLVLFKESETYYTQFVDGPDYTADDILSGAIVDVTAVDAAFPIYQIHPSIGCDLKGSVQLCDNRLIWASKTGHVYTLISANAYSNANIYRLTDSIGPQVDKVGEAWAGQQDGWYYLIQGDRALVMDFRSYAARRAASYAKDRAPVPWYIWTWAGPHPVAVISDERDGMLWIAGDNGYQTAMLTTGRFVSGDRDIIQSVQSESTQGIAASFRTKLYDFGSPETYKRVISLTAKAGGKGRMDIAFLTERGETAKISRKELYAENGPRDPGYMRSMKLLPVAPRVQQLGIKISMPGGMAVSGLTFHYKLLR